MGIIGAIVGFLAGIAVAYWLVEKRLDKQKQQYLQQTRKITDEIEVAQISRLQETVESRQGERESHLRQLISEHENQLRQVAADYEQQLIQIVAERDRNHEIQLRQIAAEHDTNVIPVNSQLAETDDSRLQETLQSMQQEHEAHLLRLADELHQDYQGQMEQNMQALQDQHEIRMRQTTEEYENREIEMQLTVESLQEQYESQLRAAHEQLEAHEAQMQATIESLQEQYESQSTEKATSQPYSSQLTNQLNPTEVGEQFNETEFTPTQSFELNQTEVTQQSQVARQVSSYSLAQLMGCVQSQDTETRKFAASALGKMGAANPLRIDGQRAIETLGKLAQDVQPEVREAAVEALATIKSEKVIPLLQKALRDTNGRVAQSASAALNKFKFYPRTPAVKRKIIDIRKPRR
ncbi:PBS lyase [filamentous cyanobacterium Phorm 46]|nr:PBS lyase [filamentous cyanobacterium Phorm 46]